MAKVKCWVELPVRSAMWLGHVAKTKKMSIREYAGLVLLRHLHTTLGIDLGQSPPVQEGGSYVESREADGDR